MAADLIETLEQKREESSIKVIPQALLSDVAADRAPLLNLVEKMGSGSNIIESFAALLAVKALYVKLGAGKALALVLHLDSILGAMLTSPVHISCAE